MADAALYNCRGEKVEDIVLPDPVFDAAPNQALLYQALVRLGRVRRVGSVSSKRRDEIERTSAKWYRQKGTGHARHGSRSAAGFVGGHKAHGPKGRRTWDGLPLRARRQAMFAAVSDKRRHGRLTVLDRFEIDDFSTKRFAEILHNLEAHGKVLVLVGAQEDPEQKVYRSGRNLPGVTIRIAPHLSLQDVMAADRLILTRRGLETLQEVWLS
jgi:large subunit ribosomal protein L4